MSDHSTHLFIINCAAITADLQRISNETNLVKIKSDVERATDALIEPYVSQIDFSIRSSSIRMAEFYQIFYMLDIRLFISGVLADSRGTDWWDTCVPEPVVRYAKENKLKESKEGLSPRSRNLIDYTTFGQLGEIIRFNWTIFAGLFPGCEIERLERVFARLNTARGPIAHCGYLPEDEVVRLKLAIKDWYALTE